MGIARVKRNSNHLECLIGLPNLQTKLIQCCIELLHILLDTVLIGYCFSGPDDPLLGNLMV